MKMKKMQEENSKIHETNFYYQKIKNKTKNSKKTDFKIPRSWRDLILVKSLKKGHRLINSKNKYNSSSNNNNNN